MVWERVKPGEYHEEINFINLIRTLIAIVETEVQDQSTDCAV